MGAGTALQHAWPPRPESGVSAFHWGDSYCRASLRTAGSDHGGGQRPTGAAGEGLTCYHIAGACLGSSSQCSYLEGRLSSLDCHQIIRETLKDKWEKRPLKAVSRHLLEQS